MTYPVIYDVTYSYSVFQQSQGDNAFPGTQVDADLAGLADSLANLSTFVQGVMRSDGALQNGIVTYDSLSPSLQTNGLAGATAWTTGTPYVVGAPVAEGENLYRCAIAHTSGDFATDLAAGKWTFVLQIVHIIGVEVQAWDADLDAIAALTGTGLAVRTADDTWAQRSIAGTANEITLTNGDGVSGNPTASLPTALTFTGKTVTGGAFASAVSFNKVVVTAPATSATLTLIDGTTLTGPAASGTAMTLGNAETVTGVKTFGSAGAVGRLKIAGTTSGSTVLDAAAVASGTLTLPAATDTLVGKATTDTLTNKSINASSNTITNLTTAMFAANVVDTDATLAAASSTRIPAQSAVKSYVDNAVTGLFWKPAVALATTANITLSGEQTIDGTLTSASRVLVKNQSTASQNGVYVSAAGAWARAADMDAAAEFPSATVFVQGGTVNGDTQWTCTNNSVTVGSTSVAFAQVSGAGTYSAGTGLQLSGNQFSIDATVATLTGSQALTNKTYNGNQWTAGTGVLTLGAGKTLSVSNTLTFTGTDGSSVAFGTGGTIGAVGYSVTGQIAATATNDSAAAGKVGEYIEGTGTAVAIVNNTAKSIASITLTAGDWDVSGFASFSPAATTSTTYTGLSLSTVDNTLDTTIGRYVQIVTPAVVAGAGVSNNMATPPVRVSLSTTTIFFAVVQAGFTVNTNSASAKISARRVR